MLTLRVEGPDRERSYAEELNAVLPTGETLRWKGITAVGDPPH
jgi:hypothetical protein